MSGQTFIHLDQPGQNIHDRAAAQEIINRVNLSLSSELNLEKLIQVVTDAGTQISGAEFGAFFYNSGGPNGETFVLSALSCASRKAFEKFPVPQNNPLFEPIFLGQGVVRSDDITREARFGEKLPQYGIPESRLAVRSYLAVPVVSRSGRVHGGLVFGHLKTGVFSAQMEEIIVGIAAQAAVSIDNAQLYEQVQRNEERLRSMANTSPAFIWTANPTGAIIFHNQRWLDYTGIKPEENTLDWPARVLHPDDLERCIQTWNFALEQGTEYEIEVRNCRHDGQYRWFLTRATPIRNAQGQIIEWHGSTTDIHDRKLVEEALRESEERFARFMQQLPGLAWIKDIEGRYVYANEAAEKAFQTPREKLYGRTDHDIFPAQIADQFTENDRRALASEAGTQVVETLEHEDGVLHHSIVSKFLISGPDGQPALIGGMAIDITERKQAEAERERLLAELDKERAQLKELAETLEERVLRRTAQVRDLASALALAEERERFRISQVLHDDLQQLIYSQLMRLELLQKKLSGEPKEALDELVSGMKEQMTQAIHVTRALAAELTPPDEAVESLGKGLEWLARHMQEAHGLSVKLQYNGLYDTHCGELQGLLLQIVRELLFNVVKHASTDWAVLELKRQDGCLEISVQDDGVGFDLQALETGSAGRSGFGLLSISDRLRLLGGRLEIDSAPAAGTRMTIWTPVET